MIQITQSKFSKFSNLIFLTFSTFIIAFVWLNKYLSSLRLSIISSIIISLFFFVTYLVFKHYQNKIYTQKNNKKLSIEELKTHLLFTNNNNLFELLKNIFDFKDTIKLDNNHYLDTLSNCDIYLMLNKEMLEYEDYINIYKNRINDNLKVFCINSPSNHPELENTNISFVDLLEINKILIDSNTQINNYAKYKNKPKLKLKDILSIVLKKNKSRHYFFYGLLILATSIFTPYYIYYTIIGTILILLSLYSRFNSRFN